MLLECCCFSVAKSCLTLCDCMDCSMPGSSVLHYYQSLLKFMSIELIMLSNHLIICLFFLLLPLIILSIRIFPTELALWIRWPSIEASTSTSVPQMMAQGWFLLGLTGLISLLFERLSRIFSSTTVWKCQFFAAQSSLCSNSHIHTWLLENT